MCYKLLSGSGECILARKTARGKDGSGHDGVHMGDGDVSRLAGTAQWWGPVGGGLRETCMRGYRLGSITQRNAVVLVGLGGVI